MNAKTNRADFIDSLIDEFKKRYGNKTVRYNGKERKDTGFYITSFRINKKTDNLEYCLHFDGDVDWRELSIGGLKSNNGYHCHKAFNALLELLGVTKTTEVSFRLNDKDVFQETTIG
jgi:hypothetical protein